MSGSRPSRPWARRATVDTKTDPPSVHPSRPWARLGRNPDILSGFRPPLAPVGATLDEAGEKPRPSSRRPPEVSTTLPGRSCHVSRDPP